MRLPRPVIGILTRDDHLDLLESGVELSALKIIGPGG